MDSDTGFGCAAIAVVFAILLAVAAFWSFVGWIVFDVLQHFHII